MRIHRIFPAGTTPGFDPAALVNDAERALAVAAADRKSCESISGLATSAKGLISPIARFFNDTLVTVKEPGLRAARLGLLVGVAALTPVGLGWAAVDAATGREHRGRFRGRTTLGVITTHPVDAG